MNISKDKQLFDRLAEKFGVKQLDHWYSVESQFVTYGKVILRAYNNSLFIALKSLYPDHNWIAWLFSSLPNGYWNHIDNQKAFFDWLGNQLGFRHFEDWYSISTTDIVTKYRGNFLHLYEGSIYKALQSVYPNYDWCGWKFPSVPIRYWDKLENKKKFLNWLSKELHVKDLNDWYRISQVQIRRVAPVTVFKHGKGKILPEVYPDHPWDLERFSHVEKASQRDLLIKIQIIFPDSGLFF